MTLLANAVASSRLKLCRIDDRSRFRIGQMFFTRSVATLAGDGFGRKSRRTILIVSAANMQFLPRMAEDATLRDRPSEIRIFRLLIPRRQIVGVAALIKRDGRLEEMARDIN